MEAIYLVIIVAIVFLLIVFLNKQRNSPNMVSSTEQDIVDAMNDGNKIEAIQHYRLVHNVSLKEAKKAVGEMQKQS